MKKLVWMIMLSVVLLFSFTKDIQSDGDLVLKNTIPMKGVICMSEDNPIRMPVTNAPQWVTLAGFATLSGHGTHMGNYITE